jgi:hypothetical protein
MNRASASLSVLHGQQSIFLSFQLVEAILETSRKTAAIARIDQHQNG